MRAGGRGGEGTRVLTAGRAGGRLYSAEHIVYAVSPNFFDVSLSQYLSVLDAYTSNGTRPHPHALQRAACSVQRVGRVQR